MRRHIIILTDSELRTMRAGIRTAQDEDCGERINNSYRAVISKIDNSLVATSSAWHNLHRAIFNSLGDDAAAEAVLTSPGARRSAIRLWERLNRELGGRSI